MEETAEVAAGAGCREEATDFLSKYSFFVDPRGILPPQAPVQTVSGRMSARKIQEKSREQVREIIITNKLGVHARPAAMFVKVANRFESEIMVEKDGETVNGKSIMGLMMLAAGPGSHLQVRAAGADADAALAEIEALIMRKFDED